MSANLLAGVKPEVTQYGSMADGVLTSTASKDAWHDVARWPIDADMLAENQTIHIGISAKWHGAAATTGTAWACIKYADASGYTNAVNVKIDGIATEWKRLSLSAVVPSGMRIVDFRISADHIDAAFDATNPVLSYGSPVTLASSAHTPYATQDHVSAVYATKASLKVTDDSVKAEVSARAQTDSNVADLSSRLTQTANSLSSEVTARTKTDRMVSEVSSRLTQTADGFSASIDRLSDTDKKVNSWFGFGADASGNPQLTMGSSTSPVVGVYTNTGLAYRSRSGATLLELDGASRSSTMPHVHADDVSMGSWQLVPTQNGTHFTLQWIGG